MSDPISINGDPPDLRGKTLQEVLVQSFLCDGKVAEEANVIFLKAEDTWHSLYFDYGIIFWRPQDESPSSSEFETDDGTHMKYTIIDLGRERNIIGKDISQVSMESSIAGSKVHFQMQDGTSFGFQCIDDDSTILPEQKSPQ